MGKIHSPAHFALARYRVMRRDWLGAVTQYRKLVRNHPNNTQLKIEFATILFKAKRFEETLGMCEEILQTKPYKAIETLKIRALQKLERNDEVVAFSKKLIKLNEDVTLRMYLANSLTKIGHQKEAIEQYKKIIKNQASDAQTQQKKSEAHYQLGWLTQDDKRQSSRHFKYAVELSTSERTKSEGIAFLHFRNQHNQEAVTEYQKLLETNPNNKDVWFQLAKTYMRLFDKESAAEAYKNAILLEHQEAGFTLDEKKVVFEAYGGRSYACSPRAIYEYMLQDPRFKNFTFVWVLRSQSLTRYWRLYANRRTKVVKQRSMEYFREFGSAKYWVTNSRLLLLRKTDQRQIYLQTWHGTPFKKLGYSIEAGSNNKNDSPNLSTPADEDTKRIDYFVTQSHAASDFFDDAFRFTENNKRDAIIETGYPRNDVLSKVSSKKVAQIRTRIGIPKNKKVLLYAPTWRDDQYDKNRGYVFDLEADFDTMKRSLGDEWVILFRAHYLVAKGFNFSKYDGFIIDVSGIDDINNLYIASDALMTDYSSVFFDFAVLNRSIIFYMYDLEHYRDKLRGFYLELDELPGEIVKTTDDAIQAIRRSVNEKPKTDKRYQDFKQKYIPLDDGSATKRVVDRLIAEESKS